MGAAATSGITLVEDDPICRRAGVRRIRSIARGELLIRETDTAAASVAEFAQRPPIGVFLDLELLPDGRPFSGLEVARWARASGLDTPIAVVTGHHDRDELRDEAHCLGQVHRSLG